MASFLTQIVFCFSFIVIGLCMDTNPKSCSIRTRILNHGDTCEPRQCFVCTCRDGVFDCDTMDPEQCPELPCDAAVQISTPDRCCKICPGTLARCRFNGMSVEDGERFQLQPHGSCVCQNGKLTCDKTNQRPGKPSTSEAMSS